MTKRMADFVKYHRDGDGECNNVVLRAWADRRKLGIQERYELAYLFSITYCVQSAVILFENQTELFLDINAWVEQNKQNIVFQSDRKYIRMKDSFNKCLFHFKKVKEVHDFIEKVCENGVIRLKKAIPYVSSWPLFGRFSAFLFLETFVYLTGMAIENASIVWKDGNTATSGLLNLYGLDKYANEFDKTGKLLVPAEKMDSMLKELIQNIESFGGETNVTMIETSLCAYRKFFKKSRYNGFYLDRMLEEIYKMQAKFHKQSAELFEIRKENFDKKYLGEVSGWRGVRSDMKKVYFETGVLV